MANKKIIWIAFFLLVALQFWVPASIIQKKENILSSGQAFKFRTAPVDPNDYLRGKYIFLQFEETDFYLQQNKGWTYGDEILAALGTDSAGFAKIIDVADVDRVFPGPYIRTRIRYMDNSGENKKQVIVEWPFEKFYMEESLAPLAERAFNEIRFDSSAVSYALVKVKKGEAVLQNVYINDTAIDAYIKR